MEEVERRTLLSGLSWRKASRERERVDDHERERVDDHGLRCFLSVGSARQAASHKGEREWRDEQGYLNKKGWQKEKNVINP